MKNISEHLTHEFGQGYDYSNLRKMRQFYLLFPNCDTLCLKLSWSHYRVLIRVQHPHAREYYAREAAKYPWSVRQLERLIHTQNYERILSTYKNECEQKKMIKECLPVKPERFDPCSLVHDPYVLEFIGAKPDPSWNEK